MPWHEARPAPLVLISGSEDFLSRRARSVLIENARQADPEVELTEREAGAYAAGEIFTLASPSLFGEAKLVIFNGVEACNDAFLKDALSYLEQVEEGTSMVFRHGGGQRGKKLLDALKKAGAPVIDAQPLKRDADRQEFAAAEFSRAGRRITREGLAALMDALGQDIAELAAGCQQLMADTAGTIDADVVSAYYGGRVEATGFRVAETAIAGRSGEALTLLRHALATGVDPVPLVAAMATKLRAMAKVTGLRGSAAQLAGSLGMAPWQVERARKDAGRWDQEALGEALIAVAEADAAVKGGSRDPVYALETMVLTVCRSARRR